MKKTQSGEKTKFAQSTKNKETAVVKHPHFINAVWIKTGKELIVALFIGILTFTIYLPALQNGFVNWDDPMYVNENNIRSLDLNFFKWVSTAVVAANWHPLTMFSLAVDYSVWELNPFGYHLTNIVFHSLNTFLLFILVSRLVECKNLNFKLPSPNSRLIVPSLTALLFGIHPIHVESVAWVSERKDVLCAFFFLLSLISYVRYAYSGKRVRPHYYSSLAFFALALMSKPMAVSLPIVLLILDYYPYKRLRFDDLKDSVKTFTEKVPFFFLGLLSVAATIFAQYAGGALVSTEATPLVMRCAVALWAYIYYIVKLVLPHSLVPHYPYPKFIILLSFDYLIPAIVFAAASFYALKSLKNNNLFSAVWFYYTITLLPVIGLLQVGNIAAADRYMYLPSIGPFLIIVSGVLYLTTEFPKGKIYRYTTFLLFALTLITLSVKTVKQIGIWRDSYTLWDYAIKTLPGVSSAYMNRGIASYSSGNFLDAIKDYDMAIKLNQEYSETYNNRGIAYFNLGEFDKALADIKKAVDLKPDFFEARRNLEVLYTRVGSIAENPPLEKKGTLNKGVASKKTSDLGSAAQ